MNIILENITFGYSASDIKIFENTDISIPDNSFTSILGRNGSGKSTLLKLIAGYISPHAGRVYWDHLPLESIPISQRATRAGFLPQQFHLQFHFTVEEFVLTGRSPYIFSQPSPRDKEITLHTLHTVGITHLKKRSMLTLSGGETQLVRLARILNQGAKTIFLDEPINHLDVYYSHTVMKLMNTLIDQGHTIISILHDINMASEYCSNFIIIDKNKMLHHLSALDSTIISAAYDMKFDSSIIDGIKYFRIKN